MVPSPRRLPHTISPLEGAGFEPSVPRERSCAPPAKVPSRCVLEFVWRGLQLDEDIGSGSEVTGELADSTDPRRRLL
jgi:hypothetical protein